VKKRNGRASFDDTLSRSDFLRAFGKVAIYAAPAALLAGACGDDVGGGGNGGSDDDGLVDSSSDDDCSVSLSDSLSVSCSSATESASSECLPGDLDCDGMSPS